MRLHPAHLVVFFFAVLVGMTAPVKAMASMMGQWSDIPWYVWVLRGITDLLH